jgi:hypothetical protein
LGNKGDRGGGFSSLQEREKRIVG